MRKYLEEAFEAGHQRVDHDKMFFYLNVFQYGFHVEIIRLKDGYREIRGVTYDEMEKSRVNPLIPIIDSIIHDLSEGDA